MITFRSMLNYFIINIYTSYCIFTFLFGNGSYIFLCYYYCIFNNGIYIYLYYIVQNQIKMNNDYNIYC